MAESCLKQALPLLSSWAVNDGRLSTLGKPSLGCTKEEYLVDSEDALRLASVLVSGY